MTAFETKAIDAAYAVEPWVARFTERGVAVRFRTPDQVKGLGPVQVGVIIYSGKFISERRPVAQRWMNAYLKAAELFHTRRDKRSGDRSHFGKIYKGACQSHPGSDSALSRSQR